MLQYRSKLYSKRSKLEEGLQAYERASSEPKTLKEGIYGIHEENISY